MHPDFAKKLSLHVGETNVGIQKIISLKLNSFGIVITFFSIEDKKARSCFIEKTFLMANIFIG